MKHKYSKCLVSATKNLGERPQLLFFKDIYDEAQWLAEAIKEQLDEGIPLSHQCVLFRSMYLSIPLQSELAKRNIPYETFGGLKFYETAHVKDMLAHLKVLANPRDELSWNRALMLIERIGPKTAATLTDLITGHSAFEDIFGNVFAEHAKGYQYSAGLARLERCLKKICRDDMHVGDRFELVLKYYTPLLKDKYDDWHLRLNDLEALRQIAARYGSLEELLEDFAVEPPQRGVWNVEPETKEEEKPLILSTIHSAKGLEWESVFLMGLMDGVLPVSFALDSEEEVEEEQRLFYVAITRAKNRLFLTLHHEGTRGGISQFNKVSRFVDEENILKQLDVRDGTGRRRGEIIHEEEEEGLPLYDKQALYDRIIGFYK
jgi:DNA helicase-2/ATP-dependent DNA helicase PcrA